MSRKYLSLCLISLSILLLQAQLLEAQTQYAFRVSFSNKTGTSGQLSNPNTYLSARALTRRALQGISIDSLDLPVTAAYIDSVIHYNNGIFHTQSRWQNNCVFLLSDSTKINDTRSFDFVTEIKHIASFIAPLHLLQTKNIRWEEQIKKGQYFKTTSGGIGYYGDAYNQIMMAHGDTLHQLGFRGKHKLIAVLDEGFYLVNSLPGYDSLNLSGRIVDTYNFIQDTNHVYQNSAHGTEVLSTMAGILTGAYVGTAPDADYALYISENNGSEQPFEMDNLVAAMERADSVGADIISISLGYNTFDMGGDLTLSDIDGKSTVAAKAANTATQKGILVVASAGNDGAAATWGKILTPGDADSALTCGSVDINMNRAGTSGKGPNAAGVLKPDVCMLGAPGIVLNNGGTTSAVGGTSIATPELAGLAACLWEAFPTLKPYDLRKAIRESAHVADMPNNELGYGVPNFAKAYKALSPVVNCNCSALGIYAFPNPIRDKVMIQVNHQSATHTDWVLHNSAGTQLMRGQNKNDYFEVTLPSSLPSGIYLLRVSVGEETKLFKMEK